MTMRRADFESIAKILREYQVIQKDLGDITVRDLAEKFSRYFKQSNPTFDKGKFLRACGFYQE